MLVCNIRLFMCMQIRKGDRELKMMESCLNNVRLYSFSVSFSFTHNKIKLIISPEVHLTNRDTQIHSTIKLILLLQLSTVRQKIRI